MGESPPDIDEESDPSEEFLFDDRPIPPGVANDMHTLECSPPDDVSETFDQAEYVRRARQVLDELEDALYNDLGVDGDLTALGISEGRNTITGAHGLILRRLMRRGRYSEPLAEIFSDSGRLDLRGKQRFYEFRHNAYRYGLDLWVHEVLMGERLVRTAFVIATPDQDSDKFWYLARLLVTPFEIDQWREPFLETACGRPS